MNEINLDIQEVAEGAVITAVGVGGGGSNMITHLLTTSPHKAIKLIATNTDIQHLEKSGASIKMKLGERLTKGLGAGMQPDIGEKAALETYEELKTVLQGSDIVFISAGLGGGTGTGAAPVVAKAAKEVGALTVSIVTKPFSWEGPKRSKLAEEGLRNLKAESDCIIVIPNDRLLSIIPKNCGLKDSFKIVNDVLAQAVNGISGVILNSSDGINVDFADARTIMGHRGLALMGVGEATGGDNGAASEAMRMAIESPLLDNISIRGAMGVLVNFETHENYPLVELSEAMNIVQSMIDSEDAHVVFGQRTLRDVAEDYVRVTVVATGFEKEVVRDGEKSANTNFSQQTQEGLEHSQQSLRIVQKVSNGEYNLFDNESIDVPTYLRNQKD